MKWWNANGDARASDHVMEYCLGDADGSATMWTADADTDVDGDGALDAVGLDFDGDGLLDDAMADLDGDGLADHAVLDLTATDAGGVLHRRRHRAPGRWASDRAGQLRWFGLDGVGAHRRQPTGRRRR